MPAAIKEKLTKADSLIFLSVFSQKDLQMIQKSP